MPTKAEDLFVGMQQFKIEIYIHMLIFIVFLSVICNSHIIIGVCDQILSHAHFITFYNIDEKQDSKKRKTKKVLKLKVFRICYYNFEESLKYSL